MENLNQKRALTIQEAAIHACVSRGTIKTWIDRYGLPFEDLPGRGPGKYKFIRIRLEDLDAFLDAYRIDKAECNPNMPRSDEELTLIPGLETVMGEGS